MVYAADIHIGITGNNRGLLTPCGCTVPSGGWARISTMAESLNNPNLLIGAGNHFFHHTPIPKEDQIFEQKKALFQAKMFADLNFDVINAGQFDLCYGLNVLKSLQEKHALPLISANILDMNGKAVFPPFKIIEHDNATIMFVGICQLSDGFNFKIADPLKTLKSMYENGDFEQADLVILLADAPARMLSDFVKEHEGIDMIIASKEHAHTELPIHYNKTALIQMGSQGKHLAIIDLHYSDEDQPWQDMTPLRFKAEASQTALKQNIEHKMKYKRQLKRTKKQLKRFVAENPNHYGLKMILLDDSINDDPDIRKQVEAYTPYP